MRIDACCNEEGGSSGGGYESILAQKQMTAAAARCPSRRPGGAVAMRRHAIPQLDNRQGSGLGSTADYAADS